MRRKVVHFNPKPKVIPIPKRQRAESPVVLEQVEDISSSDNEAADTIVHIKRRRLDVENNHGTQVVDLAQATQDDPYAIKKCQLDYILNGPPRVPERHDMILVKRSGCSNPMHDSIWMVFDAKDLKRNATVFETKPVKHNNAVLSMSSMEIMTLFDALMYEEASPGKIQYLGCNDMYISSMFDLGRENMKWHRCRIHNYVTQVMTKLNHKDELKVMRESRAVSAKWFISAYAMGYEQPPSAKDFAALGWNITKTFDIGAEYYAS
jgi:hypothetical protein